MNTGSGMGGATVTTGNQKNVGDFATRRWLLQAFVASAVAAAPLFAPTFGQAAGFVRGGGDIRRLRMYNGRTDERLDVIYWIEGRYIRQSMRAIDYFMRDWREGEVKRIDRRTVDVLAAVHGVLDTQEPFLLLSGYRTAKTNAMLRRTSRAVARSSLHMRGQAADVRLTSRSVAQLYRAASACRAGGVGRYSRQSFVHLDCGALRHWGR